jgi:chemotaxis protein MotB
MKPSQVIIVKKPRREAHGGHHGGAWKVAYADFVTAMMAFFLVMWLVAQSTAVKKAVAGYFKDPGVFEYQKGNSLVPMGEVKATKKPGEDDEALSQAAVRLEGLLSQMPEFKELGKQIDIQVSDEGMRVELQEASESTFFDTGSAALKPATERILGTIARELGKLENSVIVEGHTDSRPYSMSDGYSNWELSADRANAARRVMERSGLRAHQVQGVRGYADTRLRMPDDALNSRNRRVSIVVRQTDGREVPAGLAKAVAEATVEDAGTAVTPAGRH